MLIAITGTPGTGKTIVAKLLAKKLGAKLISIRKLIENRQIKYSYDKKRKTKIVDEKDLQKAVAKEIGKGKINIVESHLAHLIKADYVFVLRTNPKELYRRLKRRKWRETKIKENVLAEFLDETIIGALAKNKRNHVFELDTSRKSARQTAKLIGNILNNYSLQKRYLARIDWTEKYKNFAIWKIVL